MKILFVDDEPSLLEIYTDELEHAFPESLVDTAVDGEDALEKYKVGHHDIVLTDGRMPKMDGIELSKVLSQLEKPPIIFMITGHHHIVEDKKIEDFGISKVFLKPVDFDELIEEIKKALKPN